MREEGKQRDRLCDRRGEEKEIATHFTRTGVLPVDTFTVFRTLSVRQLIREKYPQLTHSGKTGLRVYRSTEEGEEEAKERESGLAMTRVLVGDSLSLCGCFLRKRIAEEKAISLVCGIWLSLKVKLKNVCSSQMNVCFDENTPFAWMSCCEQAERETTGESAPLSPLHHVCRCVCVCMQPSLQKSDA